MSVQEQCFQNLGVFNFADTLHAQQKQYNTLKEREKPKKHNMASVKSSLMAILMAAVFLHRWMVMSWSSTTDFLKRTAAN